MSKPDNQSVLRKNRSHISSKNTNNDALQYTGSRLSRPIHSIIVLYSVNGYRRPWRNYPPDRKIKNFFVRVPCRVSELRLRLLVLEYEDEIKWPRNCFSRTGKFFGSLNFLGKFRIDYSSKHFNDSMIGGGVGRTPPSRTIIFSCLITWGHSRQLFVKENHSIDLISLSTPRRVIEWHSEPFNLILKNQLR